MPGKPITLVVNPAARRARPILAWAEGDRAAREQFREILVLGRDGPMPALFAQVRARGAGAGDVVAVAGGDGTIQGAAHEILSQCPAGGRPVLLIVPGGSHDNLARNLGAPSGDPIPRLARWIERAGAGEKPASTRTVGTIDVEGRYGFIFCNGLAHRFLDEYFALGGGGGRDAVRLTARWLARIGRGLVTGRTAFPPLRADVQVNAQTIRKRAFSFILAATIPSMGLGLRACFRAAGAPHGTFHLVAPPASAAVLALHIHRLFLGRPIVHPDSFEALARRVAIQLEEPTGYILDGERLDGTDRIEIAAGPGIEIAVV